MELLFAIILLAACAQSANLYNSNLKSRAITRPFITGKEKFTKEELAEFAPFTKPSKEGGMGINTKKSGSMGINKHIVGGAVSTRGQFPWQAAMIMDDDWFCGGSLITSTHILTAAHCVEGASTYLVTLGAQDREVNETGRISITSKRGIAHPKWDSQAVKNDIAIVYLPSPVYTSKLVRLIRLPRRTVFRHGYVGSTTTISGWGRLSDASENVSTILYNLHMEVVSLMNCAELYGKGSVSTKNLCVHSQGNKGTCNGDSGGPLVYRESDGAMTQIGIVSYGAAAGCGAGYPDVFTRVGAYFKWIQQRTGINFRN